MFGAMLVAVGTIVATSVPFIVAMFLFPDAVIGNAVEGSAQKLVLVLVFLSPLEALDQVFVSLFAVFTKPTAIFFRKYLLTPGLRLVVVLVLAYTNASVAFLAVGYLLSAIAGILIFVVMFVGALRERGLLEHFRPRQIVLPFRAVFEFSIPLITGELSLLSLKMGGVFVLAHFHSVIAVADYRVVFGAARLNTAITTSFATLFLPVIARLYARRDIDELRRSYWHTAAFVAVFSFPIFALTGPLAPATTRTLFGDQYAGSAPVLAVLAVGYYVNVVLGFNTYALQVVGRIRYLVGVNLGVALGNIALCLLLAPKYAAVGVAAANCAALVGQNVLTQLALRKSINTSFLDRGCWSCYGWIVVGSVLLLGFQRLVEPGIFLSVAAAAVVSIGVLAGSKPALKLSDTFPELLRVPLLSRVIR
jgi:O-antigen/teichoic acid export membrane protein